MTFLLIHNTDTSKKTKKIQLECSTDNKTDHHPLPTRTSFSTKDTQTRRTFQRSPPTAERMLAAPLAGKYWAARARSWFGWSSRDDARGVPGVSEWGFVVSVGQNAFLLDRTKRERERERKQESEREIASVFLGEKERGRERGDF